MVGVYDYTYSAKTVYPDQSHIKSRIASAWWMVVWRFDEPAVLSFLFRQVVRDLRQILSIWAWHMVIFLLLIATKRHLLCPAKLPKACVADIRI